MVLSLPAAVWAINLLQNDGLEQPFVKYGEWSAQGHTFDLEVAHAWERFFIPAGTYDDGDKLRYFSASAVEFLYGYTEKRDGDDAQLYWSTKPFDAGIYQQVAGLTVGEYYGFQAGVLQIYGNTTNPTNYRMFRSVGIDPFGGTDPASPDVIWGPEEGLNADWFYPGVGVQAKSITMTVFVRVRSIDDAPLYEENSVWVDDTFLDVAPTTSLTLTVDSPTQVTANWSGDPRDGFHLFAYEAQYRPASDASWTDLQMFDSRTEPVPTNTSAAFGVEPGVEYVVRARTWHEQDGADSHEVPGPWVEARVIAGGLVYGQTVDNRGAGLAGVTVAVDGDPSRTTTSGAAGAYELVTGAGHLGLVAASEAGWTTSQPVKVTVADEGSLVPLTIMLQPPDNVIANGDFEAPFPGSGWTATGVPPIVNDSEQYNGAASLRLTGTVTLSQSAFISNGYQPVLSFWYKTTGEDADFTAEILGGDSLASANSRSLPATGDWQPVSLPLNLTEMFTGPVEVRFSLAAASPDMVVYLDAISLGSSREFQSVFLPIILK
jgi:hypothetical protein